MKKSIAILLLTSSTLFAGELPELADKPWLAWYSGYEGKKFHFGVDPDGAGFLIPLKKKDERFTQSSWIRIKPVVQEILPDGRIVSKTSLDDGWEAVTPESPEAEKVVFRGTATGGAKYEVRFEVDGDEVLGSGHILDKGELTKNPIRFSFHVTVPNNYKRLEEEKLEERTEDDRVEFLLATKKKEKYKGNEMLDVAAKECKGIRAIKAEIDYYKGPKIELDGGDIGLFEIINPRPNPVAQGFTVAWSPDPLRNAGGKGVMTLKFK